MFYKRSLEQTILKVSQDYPVMLLTGPRQVGKTTLLKSLSDEDRRYVTLDDPEYISLINKTPVVLIKGYDYRHKSAFEKNAHIIRKYFTPKKCYLDNISKLMKTIRSILLILIQ